MTWITRFLDRHLFNPHWRTIRHLGQVKILGISATTLIVVPMLSRSLVKVNEMKSTIEQAHPILKDLFPLIQFHLELPWSLKLVIGSAVFVMIGKLIYEVACPLYIKRGDSYEVFRHSQADAQVYWLMHSSRSCRRLTKQRKDN